jgi:hypothetical protein
MLRTHNFRNGPVPDTPEEIFAEIGCRLVLLQDLEAFINFVTRVVFESDPEKAKEAILKSDKKTMGQLLYLLRKKVSIQDGFDTVLKRVLDSRNIFIHEFSYRFDLKSKDGISEAVKYLLHSMGDLDEVSNVMKAAIVEYGKERGIHDPYLEASWRKHGDLEIIETVYIPKVAKTFGDK